MECRVLVGRQVRDTKTIFWGVTGKAFLLKNKYI